MERGNFGDGDKSLPPEGSSSSAVATVERQRSRRGGRAVRAAKDDRQRPPEDTTHSGLMAALGDETRATALLSKVCFLARARYGILPQDAEDIFSDSVVTYLKIHQRYPLNENHFGILVGVFHKKSLEFLDGRDRSVRVARRFIARLQAERPELARGEDPSGAAVERVLREEDATLIRAAIASLPVDTRELLLKLAEGGMTRLEMIEALGINRNTFDTRLRAVRLRLKEALENSGVL